jgi:NAD(P)-dependent dehydrogenase (short-subunit alcohol dehydrogenase family)
MILLPLLSCVAPGTDGIGKFTAGKLAQTGASVYVHGRNEQRVAQSVADIKKLSPNADKVQGLCADISTLKGMRSLCEQLQQRTDKLDCLINNAGIFEGRRQLTEDGIELVLATNVLAPYVITGLLLPLLRKGSASRVITVSSISQGYPAGLKDLQFEKGGFSDHSSYSLSKVIALHSSDTLDHVLLATIVSLQLCEAVVAAAVTAIVYVYTALDSLL